MENKISVAFYSKAIKHNKAIGKDRQFKRKGIYKEWANFTYLFTV